MNNFGAQFRKPNPAVLLSSLPMVIFTCITPASQRSRQTVLTTHINPFCVARASATSLYDH